jgi:hypothetical protein
VLSTTSTAARPGKRHTATAAPISKPSAVAIAQASPLTLSDRPTMWTSCGSPSATSCTARAALSRKGFIGGEC